MGFDSQIMNVCVIGCTGYLGSKISNHLSSVGMKVTGLCRRFPKQNQSFKNNFHKIIEGDITDSKILDRLARLDISVFVYTVSLNHKISEKNFKKSLDINYFPLVNLCSKLALKNNKIRIIYFSTMQVYGNYGKKKIINEDNRKELNNIYSLTHSLCEDFLSNISYKDNIETISLRLSNGYGAPYLSSCDCWWLVVNDFCKNAITKNLIEIKSDGSALRDFIHINDISKSVERLLSCDLKNYDVINLCSGKTFTILEIALIVKNELSKLNISARISLMGKNLNESDILLRIKSLNKKRKFKISNTKMRKLKIIPELSIKNGVNETLLDLKDKLV